MRALLASGNRNTFAYDADGRRVKKEDSGGTSKILWDLENVLLETNSSDVAQVVYTLEPDLYGHLVSEIRSGTTSFFHFDALGCTTRLTNLLSSITDNYTYEAFGSIRTGGGSSANPFRYLGVAGYYFDHEQGNYSVRLRIYSPTSGRFISKDPFLTDLRLNSYNYVANRPALHSDPSGADQWLNQCVQGCLAVCRDRISFMPVPACKAGCWAVCKQVRVIHKVLDFICKIANDQQGFGSDLATCICGLGAVADLLPIYPRGIDRMVEQADCWCNILTNIQTCCKEGVWSPECIGYLTLTVLDCKSLALGTIIGCLAGTGVGLIASGAPGGIQGCLIGYQGGKIILEPIIDMLAFMGQNSLTQGTVVPANQTRACLNTLGLL